MVVSGAWYHTLAEIQIWERRCLHTLTKPPIDRLQPRNCVTHGNIFAILARVESGPGGVSLSKVKCAYQSNVPGFACFASAEILLSCVNHVYPAQHPA